MNDAKAGQIAERFAPLALVLTAACGPMYGSVSNPGPPNQSQRSAADSVAVQQEGRLLGLRTVGYYVEDLDRAKEWYSAATGVEPYFDEPFYVGFSVGGYELGLMPIEGKRPPDAGRVVVYWGVPNVDVALARLLEIGARLNEAVEDVGGGVRTATVRDPFGNVFGIIENPSFQLPVDADG